jgi:MSHA pilin protein MshA
VKRIKNMNKQSGFTLVELVVVIVVLGLLAATALPKFINVTNNARVASLQGIAGGLRSAASLAQSQYVLNGVNTAVTVTMGATPVAVLSESANTGLGGRPLATAAGISAAMPDPDGFNTPVYAGSGATGTATYQPTSGGSATCQVQYTAGATGDPVVVTKSGC